MRVCSACVTVPPYYVERSGGGWMEVRSAQLASYRTALSGSDHTALPTYHIRMPHTASLTGLSPPLSASMLSASVPSSPHQCSRVRHSVVCCRAACPGHPIAQSLDIACESGAAPAIVVAWASSEHLASSALTLPLPRFLLASSVPPRPAVLSSFPPDLVSWSPALRVVKRWQRGTRRPRRS